MVLKAFAVMYNKSGELINYPAGNLLAHFKRYAIIKPKGK